MFHYILYFIRCCRVQRESNVMVKKGGAGVMSPGIENNHHPWLLWVNNKNLGRKKVMPENSNPDVDLNRSTKHN